MDTITIKDYQGHERTTIALSPTLTALTGKSDHGKSSVIRTIRSIRDNKPAGSNFIRKGTDKSVVIIDDITYEKTKSTTKYYIKGKKEPFKALRGAVPEEVTALLNLGETNIQGQHDKPFLLDDSPGKVAKKLSELIDLDSTTNALTFIKTKKRHHSKSRDVLNKSIENTELQLASLEHVDKADKELAKIERKGTALVKLREKRSQLYVAHENAVQAKYELSRIPSISALKPAKQLVQHYDELQSLIEQRDKLEKTTNNIIALEHMVSFNPDKLLKKANRLQALIIKRGKLAIALGRAAEFENEVSWLAVKEEALQKKKDELLEGQCPMCGRSDD